MSPAKSRKARTPRKAAQGKARGKPKAAKRAKAAKRSKPSKATARSTARPTPRAAPASGGNGHAHCAASDPFGDPCQNLPRRPSKYCVIHSYLER